METNSFLQANHNTEKGLPEALSLMSSKFGIVEVDISSINNSEFDDNEVTNFGIQK